MINFYLRWAVYLLWLHNKCLRVYIVIKIHSQINVYPLVSIISSDRVQFLCTITSNTQVIITIVSDTHDVEEVVFGKDGVFEGIRSGKIVIDMSTISPSATKVISEKLLEKDVEMLDAPVSGGDTGAINGTLAIMVGGKENVLENCRPLFEVLGKTITHCGSNGMGQVVKLCNQILVSVTNMAVSEAVLFAERSGVDPKIMIEATKGGAAGSWQLANLAPKMVEEDYAPGFMIDLQQKDLKLVLESASQMNLPLPALSLVHQLYIGNQSKGEGDEGTQALYKSIEQNRPSGVKGKYFKSLFICTTMGPSIQLDLNIFN